MYYRTFQMFPGSNEHFLRIIIDYSTHDAELTFGPLDAESVDRLGSILAKTYCHHNENWDGPIYESGIAQGISGVYVKEEGD